MDFIRKASMLLCFCLVVLVSGCITPMSFPYPDPVLQMTAERKSDEVPFDFKARIVGPEGEGVPNVQLAFSHNTPSLIMYRFTGDPSSDRIVVLTSDEGGWITYRSRRGGMITWESPDHLDIYINGVWYDLDPDSGPTQFVSYKPNSVFKGRTIRTSPTPETPLIYRLIPQDNFNQRALLLAAERRGLNKENIPKYYQLLPQFGWPPEGSSGGYATDG